MELFEKRHFWFIASDGMPLYGKIENPVARVKSMILLIHGSGDHINRYIHLFNAFVEAGYTVGGFDLRGHGNTYFHSPESLPLPIVDSLQALQKKPPHKHKKTPGSIKNLQRTYLDIEEFAAYMQNEFDKDTKLILMGHSLGGTMVLSYCNNPQSKLQPSALIITAPLIHIGYYVNPIKYYGFKCLALIAKNIVVSNDIDTNCLTRDKEIVALIENDPLSHTKIAIGIARKMSNLGHKYYKKGLKIHTPILMAHGLADIVTKPSSSKRAFDLTMESENKKYLSYPDALHELHNETNREDFFKDVIEWLNFIASHQ